MGIVIIIVVKVVITMVLSFCVIVEIPVVVYSHGVLWVVSLCSSTIESGLVDCSRSIDDVVCFCVVNGVFPSSVFCGVICVYCDVFPSS